LENAKGEFATCLGGNKSKGRQSEWKIDDGIHHFLWERKLRRKVANTPTSNRGRGVDAYRRETAMSQWSVE